LFHEIINLLPWSGDGQIKKIGTIREKCALKLKVVSDHGATQKIEHSVEYKLPLGRF
jgi:hypothetical protein